MQYFDVLYTVYQPSNPDSVWYHVMTIQARDLKNATARARGRSQFRFPHAGEELFFANFVGVDKAGRFDHFVGKYVGQFIEEAGWQCS